MGDKEAGKLGKLIQDSIETDWEEKSLEKLLEEEEPRLGKEHRIKKDELEYLGDILEEDEKEELRLPIYFRHSTRDERGSYEVKGEVEKKVCSEVLEKEEDWDYLYRPEVREVRRKLPTCTRYRLSI